MRDEILGAPSTAAWMSGFANRPDTILQLVLDNIPQGVFWKDRNSVYLGCNRVVCRSMGLASPDGLIGKSDREFPSLTPEQVEGFVRTDREVMQTGCPQAAIIEPLTRFDGVTIWVETIKVPLRDESGEVIGVLGTWQDVTERQRAEQALRLSEQRYKSLVLAMSEMVWASNAAGNDLQVEPSLEMFTGLPKPEVLGSGWLQAVHPDDRDRARSAWLEAVATMSEYECGFRLRRCDGEWRDILSRGIPLLDSDGSLREWVGVGVDITERKRAETAILQLNGELEQRVQARTNELEAANRELEAFSYSVSHDLRAPLRAIDGFSKILIADYGASLPADAAEYLTDIRSNARVMGQLVDDLLAFSRLGRQQVARQPIRTADLVQSCVDASTAQEDDRVIEIRIGSLPDCWADPALLRQVWLNLISNAVKYTSRRTRSVIDIGCLDAGEKDVQTYFIKDNGVGFDMRYAHKLFGVFQRLHRAEDYEGTGVGLATVQRVIQRHGGRIWAEAAPDLGATFYFSLPVQGAP